MMLLVHSPHPSGFQKQREDSNSIKQGKSLTLGLLGKRMPEI